MLSKFLNGIDRFFESVVVAIFGAMIFVGGWQVFNRFFLNASLSWSEEFQRYAHIWLVFLAIPIAYNRGAHIGVDALRQMLPHLPRRGLSVAIDLLWLGLGIALALLTLRIMKVARFQTSGGMEIGMHWVYFGIVIGGAYLAFSAIRRLIARSPDRSSTNGIS
jgi:TRAP-type C4-dicarboxylate transport system permease small subunit